MKTIAVVIERNEEAFFAYAPEIDGCTAGGYSYEEVKRNMEEMVLFAVAEDAELEKKYGNDYDLRFEVDLESVFKLLPEVNISNLAKLARMNPGLLRQYTSGSKKASEKQADRVSAAISRLVDKLESLNLTG